MSDFLKFSKSLWIPALDLAVPRAPYPVDERYVRSFVDVNKLSKVTLYELYGRVFKRAGTTAAVLFLPNTLGTRPIP